MYGGHPPLLLKKKLTPAMPAVDAVSGVGSHNVDNTKATVAHSKLSLLECPPTGLWTMRLGKVKEMLNRAADTGDQCPVRYISPLWQFYSRASGQTNYRPFARVNGQSAFMGTDVGRAPVRAADHEPTGKFRHIGGLPVTPAVAMRARWDDICSPDRPMGEQRYPTSRELVAYAVDPAAPGVIGHAIISRKQVLAWKWCGGGLAEMQAFMGMMQPCPGLSVRYRRGCRIPIQWPHSKLIAGGIASTLR